MKTHGMLFRGEMIQAILEGRKSVTRRLVKFPVIDRYGTGCEIAGCEINSCLRQGLEIAPWRTGMVIYAKETYRLTTADGCACYEPCNCHVGVPVYRASHDSGDDKWKSSLFMPKRLARIWLRVTDVRWRKGFQFHDAVAKCAPILPRCVPPINQPQ